MGILSRASRIVQAPKAVTSSFADDLVVAVFGVEAEPEVIEEVGTPSAPPSPSRLDSTWWAAFGLGVARVAADPPSGLSAFERESFLDGLDKGSASADEEHRAWLDELEARGAEERESPEVHWHPA